MAVGWWWLLRVPWGSGAVAPPGLTAPMHQGALVCTAHTRPALPVPPAMVLWCGHECACIQKHVCAPTRVHLCVTALLRAPTCAQMCAHPRVLVCKRLSVCACKARVHFILSYFLISFFYLHMCECARASMRVPLCVCLCAQPCEHVDAQPCLPAPACTPVRVHTSVAMCTPVCVCVCVCAHI